jgi:hypothetical protein
MCSPTFIFGDFRVSFKNFEFSLVKPSLPDLKTGIGALELRSHAEPTPGASRARWLCAVGPPGVRATPCRAVSWPHLTPSPHSRSYHLRQTCRHEAPAGAQWPCATRRPVACPLSLLRAQQASQALEVKPLHPAPLDVKQRRATGRLELPSAYAHCRRPALVQSMELPTQRLYTAIWAHPSHPRTPLRLPRPRACLLYRPGRRNRSRGGLRSMAPPNIVTSRSSAPTDPQTRTPADPSCLPRTFPAGPSPPLAGIELCPSAMALGTTLRLDFSSQGPICENQGLVHENWIFRSRSKTQELVNCTKNHRKLVKMQTQFCCDPCDQKQLFYKGSCQTSM